MAGLGPKPIQEISTAQTMKARLLAYAILALLLVLPFAGCATAPNAAQIDAFNKATSTALVDYKTVRAIQKSP